MTQANNTTTNVIIKDVQLFWLKLDKAVEPFGVPQFEIQIQAPKKREKELSAFGKVKVLADGKTISVNLKKKAIKADGTDAAKVRCVDAQKKDLDSRTVGNGSTGNVMVMTKPYKIMLPNGKVSKEGTSIMLSAVQVTELIKYVSKPKVDFDSIDGDEGETDNSNDDF